MRRLRLVGFLFVGIASSAFAPDEGLSQELFSWWRRELIEIDLTPGSWAEFEITELAEGTRSVERIRCEVLDGKSAEGNWIALSWPGQEEWFVVELAEPDSLRRGEILDGLLDLYRMLPGSAVAREDVAEVQKDRLLRRHFQDLFEDPRIERAALPDTALGERRLPREWLRLTERREDRVKMGRGETVYVQEVESFAELSQAVPLFGLLRSQTHTVLRSEGGGRDAPPPLLTETSVVCVDFGRVAVPHGLPDGVRRSRSEP